VRAVENHIMGFLCKICGKVPEYVDHILSSCAPVAATMYKQRHDRVASIVHWSLWGQPEGVLELCLLATK